MEPVLGERWPIIEAQKTPTISDNIVISWLKLLQIPLNQSFTLVVEIESIAKRTENTDHGIEIGVSNTSCGPETSNYCSTVVRSVDESITPCGAIDSRYF